jgi:fibronectin-binding protein 1
MYTTDADGVLTVSLKHGQTVTLKDLPDGTKYTITETDADSYTTSFEVSGGTYDTAEDQTLSGALDEDANVVVQTTNDFTLEIPTGIRTDAQPLVLITAFSAGALLLMAVRKWKKQKRM